MPSQRKEVHLGGFVSGWPHARSAEAVHLGGFVSGWPHARSAEEVHLVFFFAPLGVRCAGCGESACGAFAFGVSAFGGLMQYMSSCVRRCSCVVFGRCVSVSVCGVSGVAHLCVGAPCVGMRGIRTGTGQVLSGLVQVAQTSGRQHPWLILARQWDETPSKLAFGQLSKTLVSWMAQRLARQVQRRRLSPADAEALAKCANRLHAGVVSVLAQRATLRWSPEHREQLIIEPRVVERNTASCLAHALGTAVPERLSWNGLMTLAAYVGMIVLILQKDLLNKQAVLTETHHQHVNRDG